MIISEYIKYIKMGDDKFEDYTKLKLLGEGAFGKAYLVEHKITKFILIQSIRT